MSKEGITVLKPPMQIKRSLFRCSEGECDRCDYFDECYNEKGTVKYIALLLDTMDYIQQIEKERDAAIQEAQRLRSKIEGVKENEGIS